MKLSSSLPYRLGPNLYQFLCSCAPAPGLPNKCATPLHLLGRSSHFSFCNCMGPVLQHIKRRKQGKNGKMWEFFRSRGPPAPSSRSGTPVLAPQNEFGMPKSTWSNYKRNGIQVDPPSLFFFFKIHTCSRYFFGNVPYSTMVGFITGIDTSLFSYLNMQQL